MKKFLLLSLLLSALNFQLFSQDWKNIPVPADLLPNSGSNFKYQVDSLGKVYCIYSIYSGTDYKLKVEKYDALNQTWTNIWDETLTQQAGEIQVDSKNGKIYFTFVAAQTPNPLFYLYIIENGTVFNQLQSIFVDYMAYTQYDFAVAGANEYFWFMSHTNGSDFALASFNIGTGLIDTYIVPQLAGQVATNLQIEQVGDTLWFGAASNDNFFLLNKTHKANISFQSYNGSTLGAFDDAGTIGTGDKAILFSNRINQLNMATLDQSANKIEYKIVNGVLSPANVFGEFFPTPQSVATSSDSENYFILGNVDKFGNFTNLSSKVLSKNLSSDTWDTIGMPGNQTFSRNNTVFTNSSLAYDRITDRFAVGFDSANVSFAKLKICNIEPNLGSLVANLNATLCTVTSNVQLFSEFSMIDANKDMLKIANIVSSDVSIISPTNITFTTNQILSRTFFTITYSNSTAGVANIGFYITDGYDTVLVNKSVTFANYVLTSVVNDSDCSGSSLTLDAVTPAGIIDWYTAPTGGTSIQNGGAYLTGNIGSSVNYYAQAVDNNNSCVTPRLLVTGTIIPPPTVSAGADVSGCENVGVTLNGSGAMTYTWTNGITNGVSYSSAAGVQTQTVTGTDANGCQNTDDVVVTMLALPFVNAGSDISKCNDGSSVTLFGSGANTYSWDNSILDGIGFIPTATQNYTLTGTDINGCVNVDFVNIIVNSLPTINAGTDLTLCANSTISLSGAGANTYSWDNGVTDGSPFIPVVGFTTYTATGTDANGCSSTDQIDVNVNPIPLANAGNDTTICENESITLFASGSDTYTWDNGAIQGVSFVPTVGATTYTLTATDGFGCTSTDQIMVTVNALPTISAGSDIILCDNQSTILNGSGGNTYTWNFGETDGVSFIPNVGTTTYIVVGTDAGGCANTDSVNVIVNSLPTINAGTDLTLCANATTSLSGTGGISYTWDNGITDATLFTPTIGTTTYAVTGTDANGCSNADQVDVNVNSIPLANAGNDTTICENESITLFASGSDTYVWDNGAIQGVSFVPTAGATTYTLTAIDGFGCTSNDQIVVTVNALPTISAGTDFTLCENQSTILNGSGGNTYTWNFGETDGVSFIPNIGTTTYIVIGTDAGGCVNTDSVNVTVNSLPTINAGTDLSLCANATTSLSGTGGISYTWDNGITDATLFTPNIGLTTFTVTGTDANGCSNTDQIDVNVNTIPPANAGNDTTICENESINLFASGSDTYTWDNGAIQGVSFVPTVGATTYTLTATDVLGCTSTDQIVVTVNALPIISAGTDITLCENQSTILIGAGGVTYSWDNGESDGVSFMPTVGTTTYTVIGIDANMCSNTDQIDVIVNALPPVFGENDLTSCENSLIVFNATGANTYSWDNGIVDGVSFSPSVGTTTYTVTGTDANGCVNTDQVVVTVNPLPIVNAGIDLTVCENNTISLSATGALTYIWDNGVLDGVSFVPLNGNTIFGVIGTDVNGCENTDNVLVSVTLLPTITANTSVEICENEAVNLTASSNSQFIFWYDQLTGGNVISQNEEYSSTEFSSDSIIYAGSIIDGCASDRIAVQVIVNPNPIISIVATASDCGLANGTANATISAGTVPFTHYWSNGAQQTLTATNLENGLYYFNVEDSKGCKALEASEINPSSVSIIPTLINPTCYDGNNGSINLNITGITGNISYLWSTGHQTSSLSNLGAGTYEVNLTSETGCTFSADFELTEPQEIFNTVSQIKPSCGNLDGLLSVTETEGGESPYTYSWSNGAIGNIVNTIGYGVYTLTATDNVGCVNSNTFYVSETNSPSIVGSIIQPSCSTNNGAIDADVTPQIGDVITSISWSSGQSTEDISNISEGNFVCTAISGLGCHAIRGWDVLSTKPLTQEICLVSVDSVTTTNLVVWEKVQQTGVAYYNIYRESNQIDDYQLIDTVQFTNLSVFNDVVASPNARSWRYKIAAVDACGVESLLSAPHKTLHLNTFNLGVDGINITWDQYEGTVFSSYILWRYTTEFGWENVANLAVNDLNYTDDFDINAPGLDYMVEISLDSPCTATLWRAQDFDRSRSNKEKGVFNPGEGTGTYSNNSIYENSENGLSVKVYPNPFQDILTLEVINTNNENALIQINIYDIHGKNIMTKDFVNGVNKFDLSDLVKGIYFIETKVNNESRITKIIKN